MEISWTDTLEVLSYAVTIVGLPGAVFIFLLEQAKERLAEQQEIDGQLKEQYNHILDILIDHPELDSHQESLKGDQAKQQERIYQQLVSCFETAFIRLYGRNNKNMQRMWNSWQDGIDEWLRQPNFSKSLPRLLIGEDENYAQYMTERARELAKTGLHRAPAGPPQPL